jgi:putative NADH-flavin reductase
MKVVIFSATGMVGKGVLLECLKDARVEDVLLVSRHPTDVSHPRIRQIVHADFTEFRSIQATLADLGACFYCLGVTAVGLSESQYHHLTYDLTLAAATALALRSAVARDAGSAAGRVGYESAAVQS